MQSQKRMQVIHQDRVLNYTPGKLARLFEHHKKWRHEQTTQGPYTVHTFKLDYAIRVFFVK